MKKIVCLTLALLCACSVCLAAPENYVGKTLKDFTVTLAGGETFTLSESLQNHDLVLINLWATWCPPCRAEFPYLEEAWQACQDRVEVIALSVEETDSLEKISAFAEEYGLHFMMGRDENNLFGQMGGMYIPTTLIVDKEMRILSVEVGSKGSVKDFTDWFDSLLPQPEAV